MCSTCLNQGYILSYFYKPIRALSLQNICWTVFQTCISHNEWLRKTFKFKVFQLLENLFASQKLNPVIYIHTLSYSPKLSPSLSSSPPTPYPHPLRLGSGTYSSPPKQHFLENVFLSSTKGEKKLWVRW